MWTHRPGPASNLGDSNHTWPGARRELAVPSAGTWRSGPFGGPGSTWAACTGVSHCACPGTGSETLLQPITPTPAPGSAHASACALHAGTWGTLSLLELGPAHRRLC